MMKRTILTVLPLFLLAFEGLAVANSASDALSENPPVKSSIAVAALPEPLTLKSLMSVSDNASPQVLMQSAQQLMQQSNYQLANAKNAVKLNLMGRLGWREYAQETQDNHLLALHLGTEVYDFGKNKAAIEAARYNVDAENELLADQQNQYKLALMQSFFNVILADMQYRVDNEDMAVVYVGLDKAKDKHALQQISDVEYLKKQADYQRILLARTRSAYEQRKSRTHLANLVGQPQNLPDKLIFPSLKKYQLRKLDKLETYQAQVLAKNLQLKALKLKLKAAHQQFESVAAGDKPTVRLDAWGGKLSTYELNREGRWRVDLSVDYPLYDGGNVAASKSKARGAILALEAKIKALEEKLRDQTAQLYFQLKLASIERKQVQAYGDYADLYLDFSRALYENESTTDLGDAMVRLSKANLETVQQQFRQALAWAELDYLIGHKIDEE